MIEHRFDHIAENMARRRAWIDSMSDLVEAYVDRDTVVPPSAFHRHYNLKQLVFTEGATFEHTYERTNTHVARQNVDHVNLLLHVSGRARITTDRHSSEIERETFVVGDLGQAVRIETKGGAACAVMVPRRLLDGWPGDPSAWRGRIVPTGTSPVTRLLADHMRNLAACLGTASPPQKDRLATATLALCNAAFLPETDSAYDHTAVGRIAMRQFIDKNLATVDAETLMARFGLSRTPLYKLFEAEGGVYAYIRGRRLAQAMQQLTRLSGERRPTIKQLTFACGFENEQVFSRAFRRKYGLNPSEVDITHRPYADWDRASRLMAWLKDL